MTCHKTTSAYWASGGMADALVLGTSPERGEGSSPFSPTQELDLTVKATNTELIFVAQDVALKTKCCKVGKGSIGNDSF